jgi:hypothetical protein
VDETFLIIIFVMAFRRQSRRELRAEMNIQDRNAIMILHRYGRTALFCVFTLIAFVAARATGRAALINLTPTDGVNSSTSVPLSDLISGQTMGLTVGDKIFTGFNYSRIGDMPEADDVLVLGFKDPAGNWGVSFHGPFVDLPGNGASDALIRFIVEVGEPQASQGIRISDAHLFLGGVGVGPNSTFAVDETFLGLDESLSAIRSTFGMGVSELHDEVFFDELQQKLFVTKDIFALAANDGNQPARATVIDQSFSQTIPEPTAIVLAMIGMVAGLGVRRRGRLGSQSLR